MTVRYSKAFAKTASPMMDTFKSVVTNPNFVIPTAAPLAAMAVGAGANKIRDVVSDAIEARRKAEAYKAMIAAHPHFKRKPEKDLRNIYNSVYNINPTMAKDPLVAGALLDRIYQRQESFGGHEGTSNQGLLETVQELSKIRSDLAGAMSNEHKVQNRMDFMRPAENVTANMLGAYQKVTDNLGEVGQLKRKLEEGRLGTQKADMKRALEAFQKATGGMSPTAENLAKVQRMAAAADDPRMRGAFVRRGRSNQPRTSVHSASMGIGRGIQDAFDQLRRKKP